MTNTILVIAAVIIGILIVVKFLRFVIKGILLLVVLAAVIMAFNYMNRGASVPSQTTVHNQTLVNNALNNMTQRVKGLDLETIGTDFQKVLIEGRDFAKEALSKFSS